MAIHLMDHQMVTMAQNSLTVYVITSLNAKPFLTADLKVAGIHLRTVVQMLASGTQQTCCCDSSTRSKACRFLDARRTAPVQSAPRPATHHHQRDKLHPRRRETLARARYATAGTKVCIRGIVFRGWAADISNIDASLHRFIAACALIGRHSLSGA
jgi:hypothetical protein